MGVSIKTHKMLWGRSGNRCAFPDCKVGELVMDVSETDDASVVGEEAHIVAREIGGPRGTDPMPADQRDKYKNLILMCSLHHKLIDDHPGVYTIEILHEYKKNHEQWVKANLSVDKIKQQEDEAYASYVDEFLKLANIDNYTAWTSSLIAGDLPRMLKDTYESLRQLVTYIVSRIWHKRYPELEDAMINFKNVLNDLLNVFDEHSSKHGEDGLITRKFYHIQEWNPELYNSLHKRYMYHVHLITDLTLELTRAGNYLLDTVREFLIPGFRLHKGVLLVEIGPFMDLSWKTYRPEYRGEERTSRPYPGLRKFMEIRVERDFHWSEGVSEDYFLPEL